MFGAFQCGPTDSAIPEGEQSYENTSNAAGLVRCNEFHIFYLSFVCLNFFKEYTAADIAMGLERGGVKGWCLGNDLSELGNLRSWGRASHSLG